jgi:KaiC/GvpD/RAD55 family RecA-like ATPase
VITVKTFEEAVQMVQSGRHVVTQCPAHDDKMPSLSLSPGDVQPVLMKCHAGCTNEQILDAAGLTWDDVCGPREEKPHTIWTPRGETTSRWVYPYCDEEGTLLYEVLRVNHDDGTKSIVQRRPDPTAKSGYMWNLDGVRRVLYRLPEVIYAVQNGGKIHITEGEKCADILQNHLPVGDIATTNSGGAGKWFDDLSEHLAGAKVAIYADLDDAGRNHARQVRESLLKVGADVTVYEPPAGVTKGNKAIKDIGDHLEAGRDASTLLITTPESQAAKARSGVDILDATARTFVRPEWVIAGTLAENERLLITGVEGSGKSELLRQFAVCTAAGMHPFSKVSMEPKRVLYIDAENHPNQVIKSWRNLRRIAEAWDRPIERGMLTILEEWDSNIDLTTAQGKAWLLERMYAYRPDLLLLGPITNLSDDVSTYTTVNALRNTINEARAITNAAVIMEHHAPLRQSGDKIRELRPYGNGLFLKWPDFGYALQPTEEEGTYEWKKFRGDRVRGREWVEALRNGVPDSLDLPFEETLMPEDMRA